MDLVRAVHEPGTWPLSFFFKTNSGGENHVTNSWISVNCSRKTDEGRKLSCSLCWFEISHKFSTQICFYSFIYPFISSLPFLIGFEGAHKNEKKKKIKEKVNARRKSEISSTNKHLDICWRNTMYLAQDFTAAKTEGYLWSVIFKLMIQIIVSIRLKQIYCLERSWWLLTWEKFPFIM